MTVEEAIKLKANGEKISDEDWKKFSKDERSEIMKSSRKGGNTKTNPWEAYAVTEQIAKDLGNYPYNVIAGVGREVTLQVKTSNSNNQIKIRPTELNALIISEDFVPGISTSRTSGINMASLQLYTTIRRNNSGAKVYEAPDVTMYVLGMQDIYAMLLYARRIVKTAGLYNMRNHSIPDLLLAASGIDAKDLRGNLAVYRGRLNLLIAKANAFAVPKYFNAFRIIDHRMSNVFADSSDIKGQFVVHVKTGYYKWDATNASGSTLAYTKLFTPNTTNTFDSLLDIIEAQINEMFTDDDVNTMSGDILKAFDPSNLYEIKEVTEGEVPEILFDEDHLAQVENMIYPEPGLSIINMNITQNSAQTVIFNPNVSAIGSNRLIALSAYIVNSHKDSPDYRDNLEWTRLHTIPQYDDTGNVRFICGLEFISAVYVLNYTYSSPSAAAEPTLVGLSQFIVGVASNDIGRPLVADGQIEQVDWHPIRYGVGLFMPSSGGITAATLQVYGDLKNYTWLDADSYRATDNAAVTALYWAHGVYKAATK